MKRTLIIAIPVLLLVSFTVIDEITFQTPQNWPEPIYNFSKNPLTKSKILLGRVLFYDPILSQNNSISCSSCHSQYTAFTHVDHALSHGINDSIGNRNAPTLINLAWQNSFMWDGAINHLDMQALAPISHPKEMGENIAHIVYKLQQTKLYPKLFYDAYGDSMITGVHLLKAFSQFLLTIVSSNSKYDSVQRNQLKFTTQEQNGYEIFKSHCSSCHTEPLFTNFEFINNGLIPDPFLFDIGRAKITQKAEDSFKFKVPTLRNIEFSFPYMHDGRYKTLTSVLNHYTNNIHKSKTLSLTLQKPIKLNSNQKVDLIAFLLTLSDLKFLFDKKYSYPREFLQR